MHISAAQCGLSGFEKTERRKPGEKRGRGTSLPCWHPNLKGDVDVCADALLVKREDVLTFLAAPATIGGTNLGFQVEKSM